MYLLNARQYRNYAINNGCINNDRDNLWVTVQGISSVIKTEDVCPDGEKSPFEASSKLESSPVSEKWIDLHAQYTDTFSDVYENFDDFNYDLTIENKSVDEAIIREWSVFDHRLQHDNEFIIQCRYSIDDEMFNYHVIRKGYALQTFALGSREFIDLTEDDLINVRDWIDFYMDDLTLIEGISDIC